MQTKVDASKLELTEEIVDIRRVAKTVKGGRNMRFSVTVVVGDGEGHVGMGLGKAIEIPEAVRKATEDAKKKMIYVPTVGTTVPHEIVGEFGAGKVLIMPSAKGTGVIAGSSVRTVLEAAGIKDVYKISQNFYLLSARFFKCSYFSLACFSAFSNKVSAFSGKDLANALYLTSFMMKSL